MENYLPKKILRLWPKVCPNFIVEWVQVSFPVNREAEHYRSVNDYATEMY